MRQEVRERVVDGLDVADGRRRVLVHVDGVQEEAPPCFFSANSPVATGTARDRPKTTKQRSTAPSGRAVRRRRPAHRATREVEGRVRDAVVLLLEGVSRPAPRLRDAVQRRGIIGAPPARAAVPPRRRAARPGPTASSAR